MRGIADRMVPRERGDAGLRQQRPDGGDTGLERQFGPVAEIEDSLLRIDRRLIRIDQRPTTIEDRVAEFPGYVDGFQIRGAERRDE